MKVSKKQSFQGKQVKKTELLRQTSKKNKRTELFRQSSQKQCAFWAKASRNVCFFCRSCQKKCFEARRTRSSRVSRKARSAKPQSVQAREVIESVASIKCDLPQSKVWLLMLLAERSHQMMLDANKLDARCSMLDPCYKKDAKKRFQKKFSTKVGRKSGPKSVILKLL